MGDALKKTVTIGGQEVILYSLDGGTCWSSDCGNSKGA
jgi:hypothetical protein